MVCTAVLDQYRHCAIARRRKIIAGFSYSRYFQLCNTFDFLFPYQGTIRISSCNTLNFPAYFLCKGLHDISLGAMASIIVFCLYTISPLLFLQICEASSPKGRQAILCLPYGIVSGCTVLFSSTRPYSFCCKHNHICYCPFYPL